MNIIWDRGEATVAEVWKTLSGRRKRARNTVQTTIARLEEKGWEAALRHSDVPTPPATPPSGRGSTTTQLDGCALLVDTAFAVVRPPDSSWPC